MSEIADVEDCITTDELVEYLQHFGYKNVWIEDVDGNVVIHGIGLSYRGPHQEDIIVPEAWNNKY